MTYRELYELAIWIIFVGMASVVALYIIWTVKGDRK